MVLTFFHQQLQFTRAFQKQLNERLNKADLFYTQWTVLYCIYNQKHTASEISNYLNVEKPTISRTLKRLEEQQLIASHAGRDKRERRLDLTPEGSRRYKQGKDIVDAFEAELLEEIPEKDIKNIINTMNKIRVKL